MNAAPTATSADPAADSDTSADHAADPATSAASARRSADAIASADPATSATSATSAASARQSADAVVSGGVPGGVPGGRERIDAIDAEIIALIQRRMAVSAEIQASRMADGGRRLDLRRETEVIGRYTRPLGRPGTSVAMALLELGRGRV